MITNKNHWYDGLFYDYFIAPNQDAAYRIIKNIIESDSSIIDVGCGTGRLTLQLKDFCSRVDGVDLSSRNIKVANNNLNETENSNVSFYHADAEKFLQEDNRSYDYAVLSYVIHEMDETNRVNILKALANSSNKIIIVDYLAPKPKGFFKYLNEIIEFLAGRDHYRNYKNFIENGGIKNLAEKSSLKIIKEIRNTPKSAHIVVLQKTN